MIFPMSYILVAFWVLFLAVFESNPMRFISGFFGIAMALSFFLSGGEIWLAVDPTTNALSLVTFSDGLDYVIGIVLLGFNLIILYAMVTQIRKNGFSEFFEF